MRPHVGLFVMAVMLILLGSSPSLAEATVEDGAEATPGMTSKSLEEESYLYRLSVQDLRTMLHERSGGQLDVSSINSKAELVREVMRFEDAPSAKVEAEKKAAEGPRASRRNSGVRQRQSLQRDEEAPSSVKQRRAPGAPTPIITHALRLEVRYCAARGYDKSWNKLLEVIELPDGWEVRAETVPYPVPPLYQTLAKICDVSFFVVLALSVVGQNLTFIPARLRDLMARRRMLVISTAMMLRTMSSFLVQTGAFEVMMDGKLVYSALQSGKLPTAEILRDAIVAAAS